MYLQTHGGAGLSSLPHRSTHRLAGCSDNVAAPRRLLWRACYDGHDSPRTTQDGGARRLMPIATALCWTIVCVCSTYVILALMYQATFDLEWAKELEWRWISFGRPPTSPGLLCALCALQ